MTPTPRIIDGVPWCSPTCPARVCARCTIDDRTTHAEAPPSPCLPVIRWAWMEAQARARECRPLTEDQAASVAAEDDAVRSRRRAISKSDVSRK